MTRLLPAKPRSLSTQGIILSQHWLTFKPMPGRATTAYTH